MIAKSYVPNADSVKTVPSTVDILHASLHHFDVIAGGCVYPSSDIVLASLVCHQTGGTLFSVRYEGGQVVHSKISPLPLDIAKDCSRRVRRTPKPEFGCVPVFGR